MSKIPRASSADKEELGTFFLRISNKKMFTVTILLNAVPSRITGKRKKHYTHWERGSQTVTIGRWTRSLALPENLQI